MSRRQLLQGAALAGLGTATVTVATLPLISFIQVRGATNIRSAIHQQINRAGWKDMRPDIFTIEGQSGLYVTGPLPVYGGCNVRLSFTEDGKTYNVRYYTADNPQDIILSATGKDGKKYPEAIIALRNPTRTQLNQVLQAAGLDWCVSLPKD